MLIARTQRQKIKWKVRSQKEMGKQMNFPWWKRRTEGDIKELKNDIKTGQEFR